MYTTSLALLIAWLPPGSPKFFQLWLLIRQGQRQQRKLGDISWRYENLPRHGRYPGRAGCSGGALGERFHGSVPGMCFSPISY
ncbi:hypothetical protein F5883DRAFT_564983 [Diaporthe sp. PMI_573]|nr:hypothetical protein F5883DRAFT_564983 [Diaporthaceae sp. PMI_573]